MSTGEWTLTIPAPADWLNVNQRHKRRPSGTIKAWRQAALVYARQAKLPRLQRAHILAELRFHNRVRRDTGNYYPTIKACVDGLVTDYGLLPDDSTAYLIGPDLRLGDVVPRKRFGPSGEVVLTIREVAS